jgi:flagellar motor switch protein FliM
VEQSTVSEERASEVTPFSEPAGADCMQGTLPQVQGFRFLTPAAELQLRSVLERFAASLSVSLTATLGAGVTATLEALEQTTRRGFHRTASPGVLFRLSEHPYHGKAILSFSPGLATLILEKLLGATGGTGTEVTRELTSIESSVLDLALQTITKDLRETWSGYAPIDFRLQDEQAAGFLSAEDDADESVIAAFVRFDVGGGGGLMGLAVPWLAVAAVQREAAESRLSATTAETAPRKCVFEMLQKLNLRLEARLQGVTVLASQLLRLKEGDVLGLGYPVERPVDCLVNGKCKYKARVVSSGSRISLQIDEPVVSPGP